VFRCRKCCGGALGYGDITPKTPAGQTLAAVVMIIGYGIIAVADWDRHS
jgi:Ion channel